MRAAIVSCLLVLCCAQVVAAPEAAPELSDAEKRAMECGSLQNGVGPWDWRTRETTSRLSWDHADNMKHHYDPAMNRMRAGEYTQPVMHDLDFLLRNWPNHIQGLRALMQYEKAGGKTHGYRTVECYFERARRFAPDDVAVTLLEGYYYLKKNKKELARRSYEDALRLEPESIDVNYNVGLFYAEVGEYEKAEKHAHMAYEAGYPLDGLRKRLQKAGHWTEPAATDSRADAAAN
jgi:tetratricopeptide (TPR) repeat protein